MVEREHPRRDGLGWHDAGFRLEGPIVADVAEHFLRVGGLFRAEHVEWVDGRPIRSGDVVRIRVLRSAVPDEPVVRKPVDPPGSLRAKKAWLAQMEDYLPHLRREIREQERRERLPGPRRGALGSRRSRASAPCYGRSCRSR